MQFNEENKNISSKELVDILIADSLQRNVHVFGIEGLEEKIIELYKHNPEIKKRMLEVYNRMYK